MISIKDIRRHPEKIKKNLKRRGGNFDIDKVLSLDKERRDFIQKTEKLKAEQNKISKQIGEHKREGKDVKKLIDSVSEKSKIIKELDNKLKSLDKKFMNLLLEIPNLPHESVPDGNDEGDNKIIRKWGKIPEFDFTPLPHWELGERLGILDFKTAAKITGSRFTVFKKQAALLQRVLINFMLDLHTNNGYEEILPPFIAKKESLIGTGNLPKFEDDLFKIDGYDWYLIPTGEVPLTNFYANEILNEKNLPLRYVAYTPCFRSEAGSYGKDVRGIIRQHQFNKVEMMTFSHPDNSKQELDKITEDAAEVLRLLELPYRVVSLCAGDLSFSSSKTYDLEVWMPAQDKYVEISSCSNFMEFQARRAMIRYKEKASGKNRYVHTLNGSGLAIGRTIAAMLENHQQKDCRIKIPGVLKKYFNNKDYIE